MGKQSSAAEAARKALRVEQAHASARERLGKQPNPQQHQHQHLSGSTDGTKSDGMYARVAVDPLPILVIRTGSSASHEQEPAATALEVPLAGLMKLVARFLAFVASKLHSLASSSNTVTSTDTHEHPLHLHDAKQASKEDDVSTTSSVTRHVEPASPSSHQKVQHHLQSLTPNASEAAVKRSRHELPSTEPHRNRKRSLGLSPEHVRLKLREGFQPASVAARDAAKEPRKAIPLPHEYPTATSPPASASPDSSSMPQGAHAYPHKDSAAAVSTKNSGFNASPCKRLGKSDSPVDFDDKSPQRRRMEQMQRERQRAALYSPQHGRGGEEAMYNEHLYATDSSDHGEHDCSSTPSGSDDGCSDAPTTCASGVSERVFHTQALNGPVLEDGEQELDPELATLVDQYVSSAADTSVANIERQVAEARATGDDLEAVRSGCVADSPRAWLGQSVAQMVERFAREH